MLGEAYQPDVNEEKMSSEECDEGEANCEDNKLKFSGPMSEKVLIDAGEPEPIIPIKIETLDQFAPHIYSGVREFMSERETANSLTLENKDKKLREYEKHDLIVETKRSTKVNYSFTEFERIQGRRPIVLLESCALPSSASAPTKYFTIENESADENSLSVETEGVKQKKISEKAEEHVLHDSDGTGKQLEVTIQKETHAQCKEESRESEECNFVAESERAKVMHFIPEFESVLRRRAIVVLERCASPSSSRAPIKDCKIKNEISDEVSFFTETKEEMQNKVIEAAAVDGLGGSDAAGKCGQVEDTRKRETCAQQDKCMVINAERLLARETYEQHQKCRLAILEKCRKRLARETLEQCRKRLAFAIKKGRMIENKTPVQRQKRLVKQAEYNRRHIVKIRLEHEKRMAAGTERRTEAVDRNTYEKLEKCHLTVPERCKRVIKLDPTVLNKGGLSPQDDGDIKIQSEDANEKDFSSKDVKETNYISAQGKAVNKNEEFVSPQCINEHVIGNEAMTYGVEDAENEANEMVNVFECHPTNTESVRTRKGLETPEQYQIFLAQEKEEQRSMSLGEYRRMVREKTTPETTEQRKKRLGREAECEKRKILEQCYKNLVAYSKYWKKLIEKETRDHEKHLSAVNEKLKKQTEYEMLQRFKARLVAETERWRNRMENERMKQYEKCLVTSEKQKHLLAMIKYYRKAIETEMSQQLEKCDLALAEITKRLIEVNPTEINEDELSHQEGNDTNNTRTGSCYSDIIRTKREAAPSALKNEEDEIEIIFEGLPTNAESIREIRPEETAEPLEKYLARHFRTKETLEQRNQHVADRTENYTETIERDMLEQRENQEETFYGKSFVQKTLEQHQCPAADPERKRKAMERKKLERSMRQTEKYRRRMARETPEQRSKRLAVGLERTKRILESETPEQRKNRLARQAEYRRKAKESETPEQHKQRLAAIAEEKKKAKERETPEQRHERLSKEAEYRRRAKDKELAEQIRERLAADPEYWKKVIEENNQDDDYWATAAIINLRKQMENETEERKKHQATCAERNMAKQTPEKCENHLAAIIEYNGKTMESESSAVAENYNGIVMGSIYINEEGLPPQVGNNNSVIIQSELMDEDRFEYSFQDSNMIKIKIEETNEEKLSSENAKESNVVIKSEVVNENEEVNFFLQRDFIGTNGIKSEDTAAFEDKNEEIEIDFEAYLHPKIKMEPCISW